MPQFLMDLYEIRKSLVSVNADDCFFILCRDLLESNVEARIVWTKKMLEELSGATAATQGTAPAPSAVAKLLKRLVVPVRFSF
jgi:hypothetical protein